MMIIKNRVNLLRMIGQRMSTGKQMDRLLKESVLQQQQKQQTGDKFVDVAKYSDIIQRRKEQGTWLREQERKNDQSMKVFIDHYSDTVVKMELFMQHDCWECQEIDSLLNYYEISYKRNQNIVYLDNFQYRYRQEFTLPLPPRWPILRVDISLEPSLFIQGSTPIFNYLLNNGFILNNSHQTNTAWALNGTQFVHNQLAPVLNTLFLSPILTAENLFKTTPETYKSNQRSFILHEAVRKLGKKILINVFKNYFQMIKNYKKYKNARQEFESLMKEWENRILDQQFHGGVRPDEADFAMYSVLKAKYNSKSFQKYMEKKLSRKIYNWFLRMQMRTTYVQNRLLVQG